VSKPFLNIISTAIVTVVIALAGIVFPFSSFIWGVPIAVITAREGVKPGVLAAVLSLLVLVYFIPLRLAVSYAVQFGSLGLTLGFFLSRGDSWRQVFLKTAAVYLPVTLLVFVLPYGLDGFSGDIAEKMSGEINSVITLWEEEGLIDTLPPQAGSVEELKQAMQTAVHWVVRLLPALLVISSLAAAFFNFLLVRWRLNKRGVQAPDFPGFTHWWVPWYTSWGMVIGLGLALLGDYVSNNTIFSVGLNLVVLHLPLAVIIGLSVSVFLFTRLKSTLVQAAVIFTCFFYLPLTVGLILLVGVFDPLFDFRKIHFKRA